MQNFYGNISAFFCGFINTVLPPLCVVSEEAVDRQGMISPQAWQQLDFVASPFCESCGIPFDYEIGEGALCTSCLSYPPYYDQARAALAYNDGSRDMILGFKHADKTHHALAFLPWLKQAGETFWGGADFIVPVPLHRFRLLLRRYNQAALLAQVLTREVQVPVLTQALIRHKATASQGHMSFKQRCKNVRSAFAIDPVYAEMLKGRHIVLIDDVYTTGATVNECARVLKDAGVDKVSVLTLARVVKSVF